MAQRATFILLPLGGAFDVFLPARSRKSFRDELVALGGISLIDTSVKGIPIIRRYDAEEIIKRNYPEWEVEVNDFRAQFKQPGDRVQWARVGEGRRGYGYYWHHYGYVGKRRIFEIHRSTARDPEKPFYLSAEFSTQTPQGVSHEELERIAERMLKVYLDDLGVDFRA